MLRRFFSALCLIVLAIPVIALFSFLFGWSPVHSAGGTLSTGRLVTTSSDSVYLTTAFDDDTATIKTAFKTIVVKPTSLLVNGSSVASIDAAVSKVEVRVTQGKISFLADGKSVTPTIQ